MQHSGRWTSAASNNGAEEVSGGGQASGSKFSISEVYSLVKLQQMERTTPDGDDALPESGIGLDAKLCFRCITFANF